MEWHTEIYNLIILFRIHFLVTYTTNVTQSLFSDDAERETFSSTKISQFCVLNNAAVYIEYMKILIFILGL